MELAISLIALFVSIFSWKKSRSIYQVEILECVTDREMKINNQELAKKLQSGNYCILNTNKANNNTYEIMLGKIKK